MVESTTDRVRADLFALAKRRAVLAQVAEHCAQDGLKPLLFKGWAVAQYYGRPERRAMGDIDLCAPNGEFASLLATLRRLAPATGPGLDISAAHPATFHIRAGAPHLSATIDLHRDLAKYCLDLDDVFSHAEEIQLGGGATLLVPCAEHHLKIVALHFLLDGGVRLRPLEDVAAIITARGATLDWDLMLGKDPQVRGWVAAALRLAERMVEPRLSDVLPIAVRDIALPDWLVKTAEAECAKPALAHLVRPNFSDTLRRRPHQLPREIAARWPNPIKASIELERDFDAAPRFPIQLAAFLRGAARYVARQRR